MEGSPPRLVCASPAPLPLPAVCLPRPPARLASRCPARRYPARSTPYPRPRPYHSPPSPCSPRPPGLPLAPPAARSAPSSHLILLPLPDLFPPSPFQALARFPLSPPFVFHLARSSSVSCSPSVPSQPSFCKNVPNFPSFPRPHSSLACFSLSPPLGTSSHTLLRYPFRAAAMV